MGILTAALLATGVAFALLCTPAQAQHTPETAPDADIVVTAPRLEPTPGTVDQYSEENIAGFGAITIGEVIDRLERRNNGQAFSIIVNGRRLTEISDLREVPPEALARVEILGESSAGRYGLTPGNKVLNLVLKPRFSSRNADSGLRLPTEGAAKSNSNALRYTNIRGTARFNAAANFAGTEALEGRDRLRLFEADVQDALVPYRTLQPSGKSVSLTAGLAIPLNTTSVNLSTSISDLRSRQLVRFVQSDVTSTNDNSPDGPEPPTARGAVDASHSRAYQLGASASGIAGSLTWATELTGSITKSRVDSSVSDKKFTISSNNSFQSDSLSKVFLINNSSKSVSLGFTANANLPLFLLPAGNVSSASRITINTQRLVSYGGLSGFNRGVYRQTGLE